MTTVTVALDWTPNVNHIGLFVAREQGFYAGQQLDVRLISPQEDDYAVTPGKKLETGAADLAIAPFETVISLNNKARPVAAIAIYALLQADLSSIATLPGSGIQRPAELDGKVYASYKARYEDAIVQQMVRNDGGQGHLSVAYPQKLGIWNTLLEGRADATWIFDNWEGVEAATRGIALNHFRLGNYGIPYGYSPVIVATRAALATGREVYTRFVQATRQGYRYAAAHPAEAVQILTPHLTPADRQNIDLHQALTATAPHFGTAATAGFMEPQRVAAFLRWLVDNGLEDAGILEQTLFTNGFPGS